MDRCTDSIVVVGPAGNIVLANRAADASLGQGAGLSGQDAASLLGGDVWREHSSGGEKFSLLASGSQAGLSVEPVHHDSQTCLLVTICDPATAGLAATQKRLADTEERYQRLVQATPICVHEIDVEGRLTSMNPAGLEMLGVTFESEVVGTEYLNYVGEEDRDRIGGLLEDAIAGNRRFFKYAAGDENTPMFFSSCFVPIKDDQETVLRLMGISENITASITAEREQEHLRAQVLQSQKLESLGVLAGGIAHDFNNLLTSILGNANMAVEDLPASSPVGDYVSDIEVAARSAAELCAQMMAYAGKGRFLLGPVNVTEIVREMAQLLRISISKEIEIRYDLDDTVPMVVGDSSQIRQIIMNLITNASDAIGDKRGEIHLVTGSGHFDRQFFRASYFETDLAPGHYVFVEVRDTGGGMSPEVLERLFDPFFSTKPTGRGLGLAALQGIIRSHEGSVRLVSQLGLGTTFKVLLPAADATARAPASGRSGPPARDAGKVLVVDDTDAVHGVTARMLKSTGFGILRADDGPSAVSLFETHKDEIAVVLLDMVMPGMGGEEVLHKLLQIDPTVQVILSSGHAEMGGSAVMNTEGVAAFLPKPYSRGKLLELLDSVVKRRPARPLP